MSTSSSRNARITISDDRGACIYFTPKTTETLAGTTDTVASDANAAPTPAPVPDTHAWDMSEMGDSPYYLYNRGPRSPVSPPASPNADSAVSPFQPMGHYIPANKQLERSDIARARNWDGAQRPAPPTRMWHYSNRVGKEIKLQASYVGGMDMYVHLRGHAGRLHQVLRRDFCQADQEWMDRVAGLTGSVEGGRRVADDDDEREMKAAEVLAERMRRRSTFETLKSQVDAEAQVEYAA
ncbi:hypothetical protein B0A50_01325 [Salinomyces thailandicus]|uniref:Uncharacterized protein n=1 Tax=Salinomyces thailandicus TaxID=706561 RepID=A0A4U0U9Z3_9PEZI|nr:hypothetical protein B0A50_01325 [Salinomyces thailandica]